MGQQGDQAGGAGASVVGAVAEAEEGQQGEAGGAGTSVVGVAEAEEGVGAAGPAVGSVAGEVEKGDQARRAALAWEGEEGQEDLFQDGAQIEQSDKEGGKDVDCANVESVKQALARDGLLHGRRSGGSSFVHPQSSSGRHGPHGGGGPREQKKHAVADALAQDRLRQASRTATGRGIQTRSQRARQGSFASDGGFTGPLAKLNLQVPQLARFAFTID